MVVNIIDSKKFHFGKVKKEHRLAGVIELWVDDKFCRKRSFSCPKARKSIIETWYKISPSLNNNFHYFVIKYDYDLV